MKKGEKFNPYQDAMDYYRVLGDAFSDELRRVLFEVAKAHPKYFTDACKVAGVKLHNNWQATARALMKADKKVDAIKICRAETGLGLKEAKEAVEAL